MGTTIRRQPVNFDIPASPNYKFLNITNFRGLDVSSNPFEQATNTASDCLNVYVDETNTLTTRPRLEKKFDVSEKDETLVDVYPLQDGYLIHHVGKLSLFRNGQKQDITGDYVPTEKCTIFEQSDKIYLLDGTKYLVIDGLIIKEVEGYIPAIQAGKTYEDKSNALESLNLLTSDYIERYPWDGIEYLDLDLNNHLKIDYTNFKNRNHLYNTSGAVLRGLRSPAVYDDYSMLLQRWESSAGEVHPILYGTSDDRLESISLKETGFEGTIVAASDTNKIFWFIHDNTLSFATLSSSGTWVKSSTTRAITNFQFARASLDGTKLFIVDDGVLYILTKGSGSTFSTATVSTGSTGITVNASTTPSNVQVMQNGRVIIYYDNNIYVSSSSGTTRSLSVLDTLDYDYYCCGLAGDVEYLYFTNNESLTIYTDVIDNESKQVISGKYPSTFRISTDGSYGYYIEKDPIKFIYYIWVMPNIQNSNSAYKLHYEFDSSLASDDKKITNYRKIKLQNILFTQSFYGLYYDDDKNNSIRVWTPSAVPHVDVYKKLDTTSEEFKEWTDKRTSFFNSKLITRFDNNYWCANKNRYYRSRNNDPTYFPITEFNDLGNENEPITGFNVANDTTLIAYKNDKTYLIQSFHSDATGDTEYAITESKNTVGNDAIGAPIVTTLTEIPLQINYDGIYGLTQMTNVAATERIADLMSEPINQKWLNVPDNVIDNAITLNRLYWTYIILPKDTHTEIFLLDNRTNSWYYWELPIKTISAFSKDNHAEFVADDNIVYYLTTEDIINPAFDTVLVTEYYDYGKKLIPWHWQSQILYLGTMNYSKRLVNTTFIMTDTDNQDGYGLQYSFKVFRKLASSTPEKELNGELNLVRSTTKKTNISKFGFIQFKLSNITEESQGTEAEKAYQNNKLRLVGLGLKYVLLEGLIR